MDGPFYLLYSEEAIDEWGSFIYEFPDGEIEVSAIELTKAGSEYYKTLWEDAKLVGIYGGSLKFVKIGKGPHGETSAKKWFPQLYKEWINNKGIRH